MITVPPKSNSAGEDSYPTPGDYSSDDAVPRSSWHPLHETEHAVQFYESDTFLLDRLSEFIGSGLAAGDICIVAATSLHRTELDQRLEAAGIEIALVRASGQFVALDTAETLATFMVDGSLDPVRFAGVVGTVVAQASQGRRVRVFGEMVSVLWAEGQYDAALRLEALWNELHKVHDFVLYCAYPMHQFGVEAMAGPFADVCAAHSRVIPAESYTSLVNQDDRLGAIVKLQQQARSLQVEIAQRKQLEVEREQLLMRERAARVEAQEAVRVRDVFLSIAAHELRTPLTSLLGYAQLLQRRLERDGNATESGTYVARAIANQAKRLGSMIGGLLDVSRIESGQLRIERTPLDLCVLVRRVVEDLQLSLDNHTLDCRLPGDAVVVDGDEIRLEQVLQNLLTNAIKYSPAGGPIVVRVEQHDRQACLLVTDSGIGIPEHEQYQLFERFYRARNADEQLLSGMGIGLHIVKEIVTLHGGSVAVESREGQGSTFSVSLPLAAGGTA